MARVDPAIAPLETRFKAAAKAREAQDVDWTLDAAFFLGHQYTQWAPDRGRFETVERPENRPNAPRPIDNRIYSLVMDAYASSKDHDPTVEVLSTNVDQIEQANAKVATAYLQHITGPTEANWDARRSQALFWMALTGEGWLKWCIDGNSKLRIEACSPLEVYLPPNCVSYLDARWLIHARGMDPEDVYEIFGQELPANAVDSDDPLKMKLLNEIGLRSGTPTVTVKELWELPSRRFANGRHVVWAGGTVLLDEKFPYVHLMLPFTQIGHSQIPGTPHYMSGTRTARPLQVELNQYHAQKIDSRKKHANHKWFMDRLMADSLSAPIDDTADQVLIGDTAAGTIPPPAILQANIWPDSQDGEWIESSFQNAVGLHEASMGQAPGRVDSAQGIDSLKEADRGRLTDVETTMNIAVGRGFGQLLSLAKQYIDGEQIVAVTSTGAAPMVHRFKTDQFPDKPIMHVIQGSGLPKNRAARSAEVVSLWSAGLLGDNPRKALSMLEYSTEWNITGDELDEMEAMAENIQMLAGLPQTPKPWQNHEVHRRVHDEARKSAEFATSTETVWGLFQHHLDRTDAAELEEMRQEAMRQAAIQSIAEGALPPDQAPPPAPADAAAAADPSTSPPQPSGQGQTGAVPNADFPAVPPLA